MTDDGTTNDDPALVETKRAAEGRPDAPGLADDRPDETVPPAEEEEAAKLGDFA